MSGRIAIAALALVLGGAAPVGALAGTDSVSEEAARREEESFILVAEDDDGDDDGTTNGGGDDTRDGATSGQNSNDGTNSRVTPVTRDRDRSQGDLTRDRTRDRTDQRTRDRSRRATNDRSRNDTRR